jgi:xylan 1,4-beta-xylosidase
MQVSYKFAVYRTGFHSNDAYTAYLEIGAPQKLSVEQLAYLNELTVDVPEKDAVLRARKDGTLEVDLPMRSNDIVLLELRRRSGGQ